MSNYYYDDNYNYTKDVEEEVDKVRTKALKIVQSINPKISCVIDPYSINSYCDRQWDYPGARPLRFRLFLPRQRSHGTRVREKR